MTIGTDFILEALVREGLTHLFMVPGGLVDPFLPALGRQPRLKPIVAANEAGAAYMADGYARASGRFGAALGIGGPGLCNMTTAVAAAKTDCSPILVLSGEIPLDMEGLGQFQDASQATLDDTAVMKPLTRASETVASPHALNHALRRALTAMRSEPRGPAHLSLTQDAITGACAADYAPVAPYFDKAAALSAPQALDALDLIGKGAKIALLVGAGLERAESSKRLASIAERWSIPVATTLRAKGAFPEDHDLSLGVFGYAGTRHATAAILSDPADVLIVLGSGFNERDTMHWVLRGRAPGKPLIIQVNTDMETLTVHGLPGHVVLGDAGAFLDLLETRAASLDPALERGRPERQAWLAKIRQGPRLYDVENRQRTTRPIHPATAIATLRKVFPRDGAVVIDSGAHRAFAGHYWTSYGPGAYVSATNLGPMGWAIPAAIGVQCALPSRRVAVVTGDGCMQMHGMEVQTAARYGLPVVYVVLNNSALGNVWLRAHELGPVPAELTSVPNHDWAGFARSLGAEGFTVEDPADLEGVFRKALASNRTALVDVKADKACGTPVYDFKAGAKAWSFHE